MRYHQSNSHSKLSKSITPVLRTHFPDGRIVTPLKMAAASAAALSFIPPLAALTAAIVAAALCRSTGSAGAAAAGVTAAFFFFAEPDSFGGALRIFLDGDGFSLTTGSATTGAGLFEPAAGAFDVFDPFTFLEFPLLVELLDGGCELGYMGGMWRGGG